MKVLVRHYDELVGEGRFVGGVSADSLDGFLRRVVGSTVYDNGPRRIFDWQMVAEEGDASVELIYGEEI